MIIPKIYLETTMFSFYYEERTAPPYLELKAEVHRIRPDKSRRIRAVHFSLRA
jgi:hypothetical protein